MLEKSQAIGNKEPGSFVPLTPMIQKRSGFWWHWNEYLLGRSANRTGLEGLA